MRRTFTLSGRCTCGGTVTADGVDVGMVREILYAWTSAHSGPEHSKASIGWDWQEDGDGTAGAAAAQATD